MDRVFIDVREPNEYASGHVVSAINVPVSKIATSDVIKELPKDAQIVTYCAAGGRAGRAKSTLDSMGFLDVTNGINQATVESKYFS